MLLHALPENMEHVKPFASRMENIYSEGEHVFLKDLTWININCTSAWVGCFKSLYNPPSWTQIILAKSRLYPLGHTRTLPSINSTLSYLSSNYEIETKCFFKPITYNMLLIWMLSLDYISMSSFPIPLSA